MRSCGTQGILKESFIRLKSQITTGFVDIIRILIFLVQVYNAMGTFLPCFSISTTLTSTDWNSNSTGFFISCLVSN